MVLTSKQINSDREAPGIPTSAVGGVEVNSCCDYRRRFQGAGAAAAAITDVQMPSQAQTPVAQRRRGEDRTAAPATTCFSEPCENMNELPASR